jgi:hypothetical protein
LKRILLFTVLAALAVGVRSNADTPQGFRWANLETDSATMAKVRTALKGVAITAIREVGIEGDYALVMAVNREIDAPTPDYDQWYIYNLSLKTGQKRLLAFGYGVKQIDWIGPGASELEITYYDCWECEAATLLTTLRLTRTGWKARWVQKSEHVDYPQPGALVQETPEDDTNEVDQVFALVEGTSKSVEAGSWFHARNLQTGKIEDDVYRYWVDPTTDADHVDTVKGQAAVAWERKICDRSEIVSEPGIGQDSKACRSVKRPAAPKK